MAAPLLIIETGKPLPSLNRYGGFAHWIRVAAGLCARQTRVVDVTAGQALPALAEVSGVVISGSAAYVTARADWGEATAASLRQAVFGSRLPFAAVLACEPVVGPGVEFEDFAAVEPMLDMAVVADDARRVPLALRIDDERIGVREVHGVVHAQLPPFFQRFREVRLVY